MNKISSILLRERKLVSLYFNHIAHKKNLHVSTPCIISATLCKKDHQNRKISLSFERKMSIFEKFKAKINYVISDSTRAKVGGCLTFEKIGDDINYNEFLQHFELPDTFQSWFSAMELHVWMLLTATAGHPKAKLFKTCLVDSMWNDVELRMEKLAEMKSSTRKKYLKELVQQFQAAIVGYDEGILSDDTVLAAAAWRMLFASKLVQPQLLENAVLYIRKQLEHIESQTLIEIVFRGNVTFLPLNSILSDNEI